MKNLLARIERLEKGSPDVNPILVWYEGTYMVDGKELDEEEFNAWLQTVPRGRLVIIESGDYSEDEIKTLKEARDLMRREGQLGSEDLDLTNFSSDEREKLREAARIMTGKRREVAR